MGFYNLNPDRIRDPQPPDMGDMLRRDGSNLASVLSALAKANPDARTRVIEFLSEVTPGVQDVTVKRIGKQETLEFHQLVGSNPILWRFMAENMSDGTLRVLGVLTALFQFTSDDRRHVPLVGIEEPEVAIHPGAAGVLRDALYSASHNVQILVTSHSPDLLDDKDIAPESILGVTYLNGGTKIGPLDEAGRSTIRERLYTAGELLRLGQLNPDLQQLAKMLPEQLELFEATPE
jgi:predicted ATPase